MTVGTNCINEAETPKQQHHDRNGEYKGDVTTDTSCNPHRTTDSTTPYGFNVCVGQVCGDVAYPMQSGVV